MMQKNVFRPLAVAAVLASATLACSDGKSLAAPPAPPAKTAPAVFTPAAQQAAAANRAGVAAGQEVAILAGGCFWGMEELLRQQPGVVRTDVGYTGGTTESPGYKQVSGGDTGHAESVRVVFDPKKTSYERLLRYYFRIHDPTTPNRQGNDRGTNYRSAIFAQSAEQLQVAERVRAELDRSGKLTGRVVTQVVAATPFYRAEDYHQSYLQKNPGGYTCHYERKFEF